MTNTLHKVYSRVRQNNEKREKNDFYPTAPIATYCLIQSTVPPVKIWEPAAGKGHISHELARMGYETVSTDLYPYPGSLLSIETGVDFLEEKRLRAPGIITNPPFNKDLPEKFVRHGLKLGAEFIAIFARLTWLESRKRYRFFTDLPPQMILVLSGRVHCSEKFFVDGDGTGGLIAYAWYIWYPSSRRETRTTWVDVKAMSDKRKREIYGVF